MLPWPGCRAGGDGFMTDSATARAAAPIVKSGRLPTWSRERPALQASNLWAGFPPTLLSRKLLGNAHWYHMMYQLERRRPWR
jgi:hypothetical protein